MIQQVKYSPPDPKTYGFQSLSQSRIFEISNRLYSTHTKVSGPFQKLQCPRYVTLFRPNTPMETNSLALIAAVQNKNGNASKKELVKIVQRLQRSTTSHEMVAKTRSQQDKYVPAYFPSPSLSADALLNHQKKLQRLSRPTTSSSLKRLGACVYCDDKDIDTDKFDAILSLELAKERKFTSEEYDKAMKRSRTPTHSSLNGSYLCAKYPADTATAKSRSENLPLLSGLSRSHNVDEITVRLHHTKGARTNETLYAKF